MNFMGNPSRIMVAVFSDGELLLDAEHAAAAWRDAEPISFHHDWRGENPDPQRETRVRALWTEANLYLRFECRYRELYVFADSDSNGRRDRLWERDVAEAFLQPEPSRPRYYKEVEVAPNGLWIDLDVSPMPLQNLESGMSRSVFVDEGNRQWTAEVCLPMRALTPRLDPNLPWRANFFRAEGSAEPRFYSAWQPTGTPQPNFHVPEAFGYLKFQR